MMPSGSVASGEPAGGVRHPFTHVAEGAPRLGGRFPGRAGRVGDGDGEADELGVANLEGVEATEALSAPDASHDATASAASIAIGRAENLRMG